MLSIFSKIAELEKENIPFAIATITKHFGSTPRHNAKMIILKDGSIYGTIGGGPLESLVIEESIKAIEKNDSFTISYRLDKGKNEGNIFVSRSDFSGNNLIKSVEMLCGGNVDIFIEVVSPKYRVVLIGGGHVNLEVANMAHYLDMRYLVVEIKSDFASKEIFPYAEAIYTDTTYTKAIGKVDFTSKDIVIIATHNNDEEALRAVIEKDLLFIGMIGSKRKVNIIKSNITESCSSEKIKRNIQKLYAPLGLDIGAETLSEIALSVMSLVLAKIKNSSLKDKSKIENNTVVVRGAGDIATGVIVSLKKAGFNLIVYEIENPTVIRHTVSLASAVFDGVYNVENIKAVLVDDVKEALRVSKTDFVPIIIDENMSTLEEINPFCIVDATIAKKNINMNKSLASLTIALGPGFNAGSDVDFVIETMRGHDMGSVITIGEAKKNTGVPGVIDGESERRILRALKDGEFHAVKNIGDTVKSGETLAYVTYIEKGEERKSEIKTEISGVIRGLLREGIKVKEGLKVGDVDPRGIKEYCYTISDKSRALGNAVLGVIENYLYNN